ncbi:HNH endonuclease signature motif containing protein [Corynebacterium sp. S7]
MNAKFYSICQPDSPRAQAMLAARRAEYEAWRIAYTVPIDEDDRDWTEHAASIRADVGGSDGFIADRLVALAVVDKLPLFRAHIESMWHLDMYTLARIGKALEGFLVSTSERDQEVWPFVDEFLTSYLTPKRVQQQMPSANQIVRKLHDFLAQFDDASDESDSPTDLNLGFSVHSFGNGSTHIGVTHDDATALLIDEAVRSYARDNDISLTAAHAELILGKATVRVVVNTYQACDVPDAPVWVPGLGFLRDYSGDYLNCLSEHTRNLIGAEYEEVSAYRVSTSLKAYLEGRDGTCRWPGCERPAHRTEKDHRINWADGGPTTASNMICLCSHHHNRKTDQVVQYILDPITADVYWLFSDGTWVVDQAEGPLTPANRNWVRTLGQKLQSRQPAKAAA